LFVRIANKNDINKWLEMRFNLWPHCSKDEHLKEINECLNNFLNYPVFVVEKNNDIIGFVEASIHDHAPGCHTTPIGFIEGWYVEPNYRNSGIGKKLIEAVEKWSLSKGFSEVASDAELDNSISILAHQKMGYKIVGKTEEEVKFLKEINLKEVFCNKKITNVQYKQRQCAYGVIFNNENKIALVKLTKGHYMPGGGMESLENYQECVKRELLEEIGYDCDVYDFICKSKEYFYSPHTSDFRVSEGYFYNVVLKEKVIEPIEKNHELVWADLDIAINNLVPLFQKEALKYFKNELYLINK
jgi:aminoglycoside 6'-N-acetyltransferase I